MTIEFIRTQAEVLATENKRAEPNIQSIFWFKDANEIRLIEVEDVVRPSESGIVEPFYFDASNAVQAPSAIAIIRSDEYKKISLPPEWGDWDSAEKLV